MDLRELSVDAYTTPSVLVIDEEETVAVALEVMREQGVRHMPVCRGQKIVGLISERDLRPFMLGQLRHDVKVGQIGVEDIYTANQRAPLLDVVFTLSQRKIGSAVIVDDQGKLTGIFTTTDALNALIEIIRGDYEKFIDAGDGVSR